MTAFAEQIGDGPARGRTLCRRGVRVTAPARLSFSLISLDAMSIRRNGIAALAVDRPSITVEVRANRNRRSSVDGVAEETAVAVQDAMHLLRRLWGGPQASVTVTQALPEHCGFGSKTTTLLAVGYGYALLCGQEPDVRDLSERLGRGRTSGASTGLAEFGGFLVDGGHRNPPDFRSSPQTYLRPSRFARVAPPPRPTIRLSFPDWPIQVLLTRGRRLGGSEELDWFRTVTPIPPEESWRTSHLVLMGLAPAVAEADYDAFCTAVNEITSVGYFKRAQIAVQGPEMAAFLDTACNEPFVDAIALSVTGPACFAFSRDPAAATGWAESLKDAGWISDHWFTRANNHGLSAAFIP